MFASSDDEAGGVFFEFGIPKQIFSLGLSCLLKICDERPEETN
jgi:hypothetical protein